MKHRVFRIGERRLPVSSLILSHEQMTLLSQLLPMCADLIQKQSCQIVNRDFALATVASLQKKIGSLLTRQRWEEGIALDANEMLILQATARAVAGGLASMTTLSAEEREMQRQCQVLSALLSACAPRPLPANKNAGSQRC